MKVSRAYRRLKPVVHFIGFRGDEYWNAVKVFGFPHYIHPRYDMAAHSEINRRDTVVFAKGEADNEIKRGPAVHR
jgi:hypothetical protein